MRRVLEMGMGLQGGRRRVGSRESRGVTCAVELGVVERVGCFRKPAVSQRTEGRSLQQVSPKRVDGNSTPSATLSDSPARDACPGRG